MDYAALKVREAVDSVSSGFPRASEKPYVLKNNPADRPIFILTLSSQHLNINDLRTYAELELKKELSRIDGISEIDFTGGSLKEINIDVFPEALLSYNLSITDLSSIMQNSYFVNSQGKVIEYTRDTNVYTDARFKNVDEMRNIPVKWDNESGKVVLLGDIAKIYEGIRTPENISRVNKEERVAIYIKKSGGANTLNVCKDLFHFSQKLNSPTIQSQIIYNQGDYIRNAISNVQKAALLGAIIAILVLFIFIRNLQAIFLIAFCIPFSITMTLFLLYITKQELNLMTLSGFAIGIGMLLDNGVVMIEQFPVILEKTHYGNKVLQLYHQLYPQH